MKVITPGLVVFTSGYMLVRGWHFDAEGGPMPTERETLQCVLDHIASEFKLAPRGSDATDAPVPLEVERAAAEVLDRAMARRDFKPRWKFWK